MDSYQAIIGILALFAFVGAKHLTSDLYDNRLDISCNPMVKIIILFAIIYVNMKNTKLAIILFLIYILFIMECVKDPYCSCIEDPEDPEDPEEPKNL